MKFFQILLVSAVVFFAFACNKGKGNSDDTEFLNNLRDVNAANSFVAVDVVLNELEFIVRQLKNAQTGSDYLGCATIDRSQINGNTNTEVVFSSSTTCSDGSTRSGKLNLVYEASTGNVSVSTTNYKVGNTTITGNYVFQPVTENQKSLLRLTTTNGKLTLTSTDYINFSVERKSHFKEGESTVALTDDRFEITSSTYQLETSTGGFIAVASGALQTSYLLNYSCEGRFVPKSGRFDFKRTDGRSRTVTFGQGDCEAKVELLP